MSAGRRFGYRRIFPSSPGVNELIIPNYKQTWGNIREIASAPGAARGTSFKSWDFKV
jgi:arsenite oxidase large subunit